MLRYQDGGVEVTKGVCCYPYPQLIIDEEDPYRAIITSNYERFMTSLSIVQEKEDTQLINLSSTCDAELLLFQMERT